MGYGLTNSSVVAQYCAFLVGLGWYYRETGVIVAVDVVIFFVGLISPMFVVDAPFIVL